MQSSVPDISIYLNSRPSTLDELQALVRALDSKDTQQTAIASLHELCARLQNSPITDGLRLHSVAVPGIQDPIRLILHPAVFEPEQWGKTFAEGLLKETDLFNGKSVVELGAGSGWISILLLQRTQTRQVLGLDLNPVAVAIARLNTWLNGSESDGRLKLTPWGVPLVEAFRVAESDLLLEPLARNERFDHVVGCIPQVLHPDPSSLKINRRLSTRDLYDLSNYCFEQGILEDRFGLPLIARALEQVQLCLNPGGLLTLILGGRPGLEAIDGMFRRRGYESKLWWSRRIQQSDDTDLASLVQLEKEHGIKFHFYSSYSSKLSIPASTAVGLLQHERPLFHDLLVVQAKTKFERPMLSFVKNIHELGLSALRKELDLSRVTEEQISFLERLTQELLKRKTLPYPHERGDYSLRGKISRFLKTYCNYLAITDDLFVGPDRSQLVNMILSMVASFEDTVLLSNSLDSIYGAAIASRGCQVVLGNDDLAELIELDNLFKPRICILAPYQMADPSPIVLQKFIEQARAHPDRWYLVDDSANFDIASQLKSNVMMRILSQHELPENLVFVYGLIKNTVCPDLELSFMLNAPKSWVKGLDITAELTYSRIAFPTQLYYEWLFDDLLVFPFEEGFLGDPVKVNSSAVGATGTSLCTSDTFTPWFLDITKDPVFADLPIEVNDSDVIRLDYGEFEAPVPAALVRGLIKGFLEPQSSNLAAIMRSRVHSYLKFTRNINISDDRIVLAQGVFPLFGSLIRAFTQRLGRAPIIALPRGSYGPIYPLIKYHGGTLVEVDTDSDQGFLLSVQAIARMSEKPDLLWLTQPNNPSGLFFESDTVAGIMQLCAERGIYVLSDEIFFLLSDPKLGPWTPPQLSFASTMSNSEAKYLFLVDGLSKSFAAGGLRSGFLMCPDETWAHEVQALTAPPPDGTLRAWDSLYSVFLDEAPHNLMDVGKELTQVHEYLQTARNLLQDQRERLQAVLERFKLSDKLDGAKRGGLFSLARLGPAGRRLALEQKLLVNPPEWARTQEWCRICFSLKPARFEAALARLTAFLEREYPD